MSKKMLKKLKPQHIIAIKVAGVIIKIIVFAFILIKAIGIFSNVNSIKTEIQAARAESSSESYWSLSEEEKSAYWDEEYATLRARLDGLGR